jgi:methylthioribulose-1-phosphate dehydratase
MLSEFSLPIATELFETIKFFNSKGWSPATSTNYSYRISQEDSKILISRSGIDKRKFSLNDFILINNNGDIYPEFQKENFKSSAETDIHTYIYNKFPEINCVLHTHSALGTVLSQHYLPQKEILFSELEIIKGIEGQTTHQTTLRLPIVSNSQDMKNILFELEHHFHRTGQFFGFLIAGHGLYAWGKDLPTATRHIETFEFLLECLHLNRSL